MNPKKSEEELKINRKQLLEQPYNDLKKIRDVILISYKKKIKNNIKNIYI